jgi:hypothetical protein
MFRKAIVCCATIWVGSSLSCGELQVSGTPGADPSRPSASGPGASGGPGFSLPDGGGGSNAGSPTVEPIEDCETAAKAAGNVGCTFYSVPFAYKHEWMLPGACFAMFVVNPGRQPVKLQLDRGGVAIPLGPLARLPRGSGLALDLLPYDEAAGLAGGDVAILFLRASGMEAKYQDIACPPGVTAAERGVFAEEGRASFTGQAFRLRGDRPVAAYQIWPYGGAGTHATSATLLLPTEAWGPEYYVAAPEDATGPTFAAVVANEDGTEVSLWPTADILALPGMPATKEGEQLRVKLNAGELVWVTTPSQPVVVPYPLPEWKGLAASVVVSNKPVGVIGGSECTYSPTVPPLLRQQGACDTIQQQVPPIRALGREYAAVRHRSRLPARRPAPYPDGRVAPWGEEPGAWQLMGVADGTTLSYAPAQPDGAPTSLSAGQVVQFSTREPFVVRSQDADHPFYLGAWMTGAMGPADNQGDPDFVNVLPLAQYQSSYVFFTDHTYPETSLVVVRQKGTDGRFAEVKLDCAAAPIAGWRPVGELEFAWVDLVTRHFEPAIPGCSNGRREMTSAAPFAVTVWGWGTKAVNVPSLIEAGKLASTTFTSYGFPAGGALRQINRVRPPIE